MLSSLYFFCIPEYFLFLLYLLVVPNPPVFLSSSYSSCIPEYFLFLLISLTSNFPICMVPCSIWFSITSQRTQRKYIVCILYTLYCVNDDYLYYKITNTRKQSNVYPSFKKFLPWFWYKTTPPDENLQEWRDREPTLFHKSLKSILKQYLWENGTSVNISGILITTPTIYKEFFW